MDDWILHRPYGYLQERNGTSSYHGKQQKDTVRTETRGTHDEQPVDGQEQAATQDTLYHIKIRFFHKLYFLSLII